MKGRRTSKDFFGVNKTTPKPSNAQRGRSGVASSRDRSHDKAEKGVFMIRTFVGSLIAVTAMSVAFADSTTSAAVTPTIDLPPVGLGSTQTLEVNWRTWLQIRAVEPRPLARAWLRSLTRPERQSAPLSLSRSRRAKPPIPLPFASSGGAGARTTLRAVVSLTVAATTPRLPCTLDVSMAIFDTKRALLRR